MSAVSILLLTWVAAAVGMGLAFAYARARRNIERLFERYVGTSPKRYLNQLRLERARARYDALHLQAQDAGLIED